MTVRNRETMTGAFDEGFLNILVKKKTRYVYIPAAMYLSTDMPYTRVLCTIMSHNMEGDVCDTSMV